MIKSSRSYDFLHGKCARKYSKRGIFNPIKTGQTVATVQISGFNFPSTPLRYYLPSVPRKHVANHSQRKDSNIIPSDRDRYSSTKDKRNLTTYSIDHSQKQDSKSREHVRYCKDYSQRKDSIIIPTDRERYSGTKDKRKLTTYSIYHSQKQDSNIREHVGYCKDHLQKEDTNIIPSNMKRRNNTSIISIDKERNRDFHTKAEIVKQHTNIISSNSQRNTNEERIECTPNRNVMLTEKEEIYSARRPQRVTNKWGQKRVVSIVSVFLLLIAAVEGE